MAMNIEMNLLKDNGSYEVLYPKTDYNGLINKPSIPDVSGFVTTSQMNSSLSNYVPTYRTVNGKSLSNDISLVPGDISQFGDSYIKVTKTTLAVSSSATSFSLNLDKSVIGISFVSYDFTSKVTIGTTSDFSTTIEAFSIWENVPSFFTFYDYNSVYALNGIVKGFRFEPTMYAKGKSGSELFIFIIKYIFVT